MQYFIYWLITLVIAYGGYRFGIAVTECKREAKIVELRKLTAHWRKVFWKEVKINTELRNSIHETCRN